MGDCSIVSVGTFCDGCQALVPIMGGATAFSEGLRQQVLCPFTCGHGLCGNCLICPYKQISLWGCPVCGCRESVRSRCDEEETPQPTDSFDSISDLEEIITPSSLEIQSPDDEVMGCSESNFGPLLHEAVAEAGYLSTHSGAFEYQEDGCGHLPTTMKEERHPKAGKGNCRPMRSVSRKLECKKLRDAKNETRRRQYAVVGRWVGLGAFVAWGRGTLGNKDFSYAWD